MTAELAAVLQHAWQMMQNGVNSVEDPCHVGVLGTASERGCSQRLMVLRKADPDTRALTCYTDARSAKFIELESCGRVSWLFHHPAGRIQIRASGAARLHLNNVTALETWRILPLEQRLRYCSVLPPGNRVEDPDQVLPPEWTQTPPTLADSEAGAHNFCVIITTIKRLDWLQPGPSGWRRAIFIASGSEMEASWRVP